MKPTHLRATKIAISLAACIALTARIIWPNLRLDAISFGLLVVAILPWVAVLFESLELPGGWKISFRDLAKVARTLAEESLELAPAEDESVPSYLAIQGLAPELALVGLRIEIERRLQELAAIAHVPVDHTHMAGRRLTRELMQAGVIPPQLQSALDDTIAAGNAAAHGATLPDGQEDFAFREGRRLIHWLDDLIGNQPNT